MAHIDAHRRFENQRRQKQEKHRLGGDIEIFDGQQKIAGDAGAAFVGDEKHDNAEHHAGGGKKNREGKIQTPRHRHQQAGDEQQDEQAEHDQKEL